MCGLDIHCCCCCLKTSSGYTDTARRTRAVCELQHFWNSLAGVLCVPQTGKASGVVSKVTPVQMQAWQGYHLWPVIRTFPEMESVQGLPTGQASRLSFSSSSFLLLSFPPSFFTSFLFLLPYFLVLNFFYKFVYLFWPRKSNWDNE